MPECPKWRQPPGKQSQRDVTHTMNLTEFKQKLETQITWQILNWSMRNNKGLIHSKSEPISTPPLDLSIFQICKSTHDGSRISTGHPKLSSPFHLPWWWTCWGSPSTWFYKVPANIHPACSSTAWSMMNQIGEPHPQPGSHTPWPSCHITPSFCGSPGSWLTVPHLAKTPSCKASSQ